MQDYFYGLADYVTGKLVGDEVATMTFKGEDSDFVRLNKSRVRQPGHVEQRFLGVDLILGSRHLVGYVTLSGNREVDNGRIDELITDLREKLSNIPEDPHLLYATEIKSTEQIGENRLPTAEQAVGSILKAGEGRDLVGIYASGGVYSGFANSLGQRNWFSTYSFNTDWSFYHQADKAVKSHYAGFQWEAGDFDRKVREATEQLAVLGRPPKTIDPGRYRVYMAPVAVADYVGMLGWIGFGLKAHRTKQTSLLKMIEEGATLNSAVTLRENTREGVSANFDGAGFIKPDEVPLIESGRHAGCLVSPRSAKEFGVPTTAADPYEYPESLDMAGGSLAQDAVLAELGTGVYINNVHYLNYSDRPACRITGMTRFATFWVEKGRIVAPLNVMRFDETIYRALGGNLIGLTESREMLLDASTYEGRATESSRMPGALIEDFNFNL
jgi:predicted Zn-dependent protease